MKKNLLILVLFLSAYSLFPQTFDLQFVEMLNNGTNYDVKIQIRGSAGFNLGTSNIGFDFNSSNLDTPVLLSALNFSGGFYNTMTVTNPLPGVCSINIELFVPNKGSSVNTTWTDVATVRFPITNPNGSSTFSFRTSGQNSVGIFLDNNLTQLVAGTLSTLGPVALPVELTDFSAVLDSKFVMLEWETKTEVNNMGFNIERAVILNSTDPAFNYETIGFIQGHVLSNSPKYYSFTDKTISPRKIYVYRLKQLDNDGKSSYSKSIQINTANLITKFLLNQNYPNPFNPSTLLSYELPVNCFVSLKVYDILGNEVATLVNEDQAAGVYNVYFNPANNKTNVSGIFFYKLSAGNFTSVRKMIFMK